MKDTQIVLPDGASAGQTDDRLTCTESTTKDDKKNIIVKTDHAKSDKHVCIPVLKHALLWYVIRTLITFLLRRHGPPAFRSAPPEKQLRSVLYILSSVVASIATVFSILDNAKPSKAKRELLDSFIGYLLHDSLTCLSQWQQYKSELCHHAAVMALCGYVRTRFHELFDIAAPIMRLESSTVFLNAFWFAKKYPQIKHQHPLLVASLQPVFVASFFFTRVSWLPYYAWVLFTDHKERFLSLGRVAHGGLLGLILVQFYWFSLILSRLQMPRLL